jgi:hypothetical protein
MSRPPVLPAAHAELLRRALDRLAAVAAGAVP